MRRIEDFVGFPTQVPGRGLEREKKITISDKIPSSLHNFTISFLKKSVKVGSRVKILQQQTFSRFPLPRHTFRTKETQFRYWSAMYSLQRRGEEGGFPLENKEEM